MENLVRFIVDNYVIWILIGLAAWQFVKAANDQNISKGVTIVVLAGLAYYFITNPKTVLEFIGNLLGGKLFGGG